MNEINFYFKDFYYFNIIRFFIEFFYRDNKKLFDKNYITNDMIYQNQISVVLYISAINL